MNKNIVIGILVVIVIVGFGFYFFNNTVVVTPVTNTAMNNVAPIVDPVVQNTPALIPDAPIVVTSQNSFTSNSTAALSGAVKPNGASSVYWFEYGESTAFGNQSVAQAIGSGYSSISAPGFISGLHANTLYYYRLSAKNRFATVNGTMYTFQTNNATPPKIAPTTVRTQGATDITRITAMINGQVNPNGTATNYWYEYGTNTDFGNVTQFLGTNPGSSFMSVATTISNLEPLTKYYFRLNAQNQFGTVNGTTMSFTTLGPVAASEPTVETSNAINVTSLNSTFVGKINPNGDQTTYWFEYSKDSGLNTLIGSGTPQQIISGTTVQTVRANVTSFQSNTKYYYHLVARNQYGTVFGKIVSFTTKR